MLTCANDLREKKMFKTLVSTRNAVPMIDEVIFRSCRMKIVQFIKLLAYFFDFTYGNRHK
jgi:hypothetical protein